MKSIVQGVFPNASGVLFDPHTDELDYEWEEEFEDAWLDKGDLPRRPVSIFTEDDPDNVIDFDDDEHYNAGGKYDRALLMSTLENLSADLNRNQCGFNAVGEYIIEVWFDANKE